MKRSQNTHFIGANCRLTVEEKEMLDRLARQSGRTYSQVLRALLRAARFAGADIVLNVERQHDRHAV